MNIRINGTKNRMDTRTVGRADGMSGQTGEGIEGTPRQMINL